METNYNFSEHQIVLRQQEELVSDVEKITGKFSGMAKQYLLETGDEVLCALISRMEKLNLHLAEYKRICSLMNPEYMEEIHNMFSNLENYVGLIEMDENNLIHCGKTLVPYTYCKDFIGKMARLSLITLNSRKDSKNKYPTFAKHIDIIDECS